MCGIAGVLNGAREAVSSTVVERMTRALAHRGPDGEGFFVEGEAGLGHRRLAILDLTAAAQQPMMSSDGRYVLTYNGEIYNFRTLRAELEALGHRFRSTSDTEVLLNAYAEWGEGILPRLNGMFAFAIWDRREHAFFLARDRYGIKPLYYTIVGGAFLFASEVKAFRHHPRFRFELDRPALCEYFTFQNYFTHRTLFSGVQLLPPGCRAFVSAADPSHPIIRRFWDYDFRDDGDPAEEEAWIEELERLFRAAVSRQLVSDAPVGTYLSGGLDSGSITAIAAPQLPEMKSFTIGFDTRSASGLELAFDERQRAEYMSFLFRTEHYEMVLKAGDMERSFARLLWHLEEPRVGQSYPNYYAAKLAGSFVKVVLAGAGGDEMFAGYPWRYYRAVVNNDFEDYVDKYHQYWQRLMSPDELRRVLAPIWPDVASVDSRKIFRDVFVSHAERLTRPEDYINHSLYLEASTFLHGLLVTEDKLSMAHGLETRLPFLDNELVDFAMRVPVRFKLGNLGEIVRLNENEPGPKTQRFFERAKDGKLLLRKVMERHVPRDVVEGVKQGFSGPDASWFKGESIEFVRRRLLARDAAIFTVLDREVVHALVTEHLEGRQNRRLLIWSLLCVEQWFRTFLGGELPERAGS